MASDSSIAAVIRTSLPMIAHHQPDFERRFQTRMNEVADHFQRQIAEYYGQEPHASFWQHHFLECLSGTPKEIEALRVNLLQRYHIFTSAFKKDHNSDAVSSSYPSGSNQIQRHHHDPSREFNLHEYIGWPLNEPIDCWQVSMSWFCNAEGPVFIQENCRGWIPTIQIMHDVDAYVASFATQDNVIKEYKAFWSVLVQSRVITIAALVQGVFERQKEQCQSVGHLRLECSLKGTDKEVNLLCNNMIERFGTNIIPEKNEIPPYGLTIDCTKELGRLHRGQRTETYSLICYLPDSSQERLPTSSPLQIDYSLTDASK